jgi:phosphatidylserine/phosphatidylglycerophosphate/cardiolipin synthase-like enzyme
VAAVTVIGSRSDAYRPRDASRILQAIFVAELTSPSDEIYIVSPWISDIVVVSSPTSEFAALPEVGTASELRLSRAVAGLAKRGTRVTIAIRPDPHNQAFLDALGSALDATSRQNVRLETSAALHQKSLVGQRYAFAGSLNVTYSGLNLLEEWYLYTTEGEQVAQMRIELRDRYRQASTIPVS